MKVDVRLSIMMELKGKWIVSTFDYLRTRDFHWIGFQEVGIVHAIVNVPKYQLRVEWKGMMILLLIWTVINNKFKL